MRSFAYLCVFASCCCWLTESLKECYEERAVEGGSVFPNPGHLFDIVPAKTWVVTVHTADVPYAGTDANIWLVYHEKNCKCDNYIKLNSWSNDHERGSTDSYEVCMGMDEYPTKIGVYRDSFGFGPGWSITWLQAEDVKGGRCLVADYSHCSNGINYGTEIPSGKDAWPRSHESVSSGCGRKTNC